VFAWVSKKSAVRLTWKACKKYTLGASTTKAASNHKNSGRFKRLFELMALL
jgi:hypothetical protein